jgi:hypothetical protein
MSRGSFGYWGKRFAPAPLLRDALRPVHYLNSPDKGEAPGFVRETVYTILIDLSQSEAALLRDCRANTRNEISRAAREGTLFRSDGGFLRCTRPHRNANLCPRHRLVI